MVLLIAIMATTQALLIEVRPITQQDLAAAVELDRQISFDFFEPLYALGYPEFSFGQHPHDFLERELLEDAKEFALCIEAQGDQRLFVAKWSNQIVGLILFHRKDEILWLDLLLVDAKNRGLGIGKALVYKACAFWKECLYCDVCPFKRANSDTLKFYEAIGFKKLGDGPSDRINAYGERYSDLYYYYRLDIAAIKPMLNNVSSS